MQHDIELIGHPLTLNRYPDSKDPNLQAWDAADEYLLETIQPQLDSVERVWLINDSFGALSCALSDKLLCHSSDSFLSQTAAKLNLTANQRDPDSVSWCSSLQLPTFQPQLVLLKLPKQHTMLEFQLAQICRHCPAGTPVWVAGKAQLYTKNVLKLLQQYLAEFSTSLAKRKARLGQGASTPASTEGIGAPQRWQIEHPQLTLVNYPSVFSSQSLDIGARFLLEHLPRQQQLGDVIDLGCGNGVLGAALLARNSVKRMRFVDESFMAVASARDTVTANLAEALPCCEFIANHALQGLNGGEADLIVCNPPFHQQHAITDDIAWTMFRDAKRVLRSGGRLRIVGNRHLKYPDKLKRLFGGCNVVASNRKFVIVDALKR